MSARPIATHGAALLVGLAVGSLALRDGEEPATSPDRPAPPITASAVPPAPPRPAASPAPEHPTAAPPPTSSHTPDELRRRYGFVRQLALDGSGIRLGFSDESFTLTPSTTRFLGLTEQQSSAVQDALDAAIDAIRDLETANTEVLVEGSSFAIGDLSPHVPELERQLRQDLAAILPAEDLELIDKPLTSLFEPLSSVREITVEFHDNRNGYTVRHAILGAQGNPINTSSHSRQFDPDPTGWRAKNPHLWRFSHLITPEP